MSSAPTGTRLTAADFPAFFEAVHGVRPFAWQSELATRVLEEGAWPGLVDVPTGLGKTALLDIAVFVTAATAHVPGSARVGRRRLFFVVDRRLVVDEAYQHAHRLADAVQQSADGPADSGVLGQVAASLRVLTPSSHGALLPATRMRGGATWDAAWLDRPDRPGIVLGTVDQVGSRLLFRGYGVSDRRRPLDAALVGTDSLVMVDEAHLATALLRTVEAARTRDHLGLPVPELALMRLSATAHASATSTYRLDADAHRDDPTAWQRLSAAKRLTTHTATAKTCARELARAAVERLDRLGGARDETADAGWAPVALIVCNTVDRARDTFAQVCAALPEANCELLIGRSRPIDRPDLQDRVLGLFGTRREPARRQAVLVATQTVEVGVNLDADVLITESASWDALVQRLGRLNRLGRFTDRFSDHDAASAVVVHDGQADGPVYGTARDTTWAALTSVADETGDSRAGMDVSPLACRDLTATTFDDSRFSRAPADVPILLSPILDTWIQTGPVPLVDPPVAPFLHGFDDATAPVQIVWRDGLLHSDPLDDPFDDGDAERAAPQIDALLTLWPPRAPEIVEVPFAAVRRWMGGQAAGPVSDVELSDETASRTSASADPFRVLAQRPQRAQRARRNESDPPTRWQWVEAIQLRPGDRIVVPAERGGLDHYGWAPTHRGRVSDVSEAAAFAAGTRRQPTLRLDIDLPARLGINGDPDVESAFRAFTNPDTDENGDQSDVVDLDENHPLKRLLIERLPDEPHTARGWSDDTWSTLRTWLTSSTLRVVDVHDPATTSFDATPRPWTRLLTGPRPGQGSTAGPVTDGDDDEAAASSIAPAPVSLNQHLTAVRRRAAEISEALQLPDDLRAVLEDAAGWHDLGKAEERFQIMLHGGDAAAAAFAAEPLAKSGLDPANRLAWRRAQQLSGLPSGARHEAWSAALVADHITRLDPPYRGDADLLLHLIASHHGQSRPLARLVRDPDPRPVHAVIDGAAINVGSERTVCLDHPARFQRLNHCYGRWGLALLESIVRCADTTVSGEGS